MTNFNTKQPSHPPDKDQQSFGKPGQQNTHKSQKGKPIMSATFYNVSNSKSNNQSEDPFAAFDKPANENNTEMTSSKGFNITSSDLKKQGITLDKVLGGGFKKIDIFSRGFKGTESSDLFPSGHLGAEIDDKNSENEGKNYDSFEILETENEEEQNNDSPNGFGKKQSRQSRKKTQVDDTSPVADGNSYNEITEKINKKYKHRIQTVRPKMNKMYRSPEPFTNQEFIDPNEEIAEPLKSDRNPERPERPATRGRGQHQNPNVKSYSVSHAESGRNPDSRSVSPNDGRGRNYPNKTDVMQVSFYNGNRSGKPTTNEQMNASRQNWNSKGESANQFRISKIGFKKTVYDGQFRENTGEDHNAKSNANHISERAYVREEGNKTRASEAKQGFINAYGVDPERERRQKEQALAAESSRMRDTGTRFHPGKTGFQGYSQKNPLENNNRIAERIRQHEQEMLSKYSSKRYTNQNDRKISYS